MTTDEFLEEVDSKGGVEYYVIYYPERWKLLTDQKLLDMCYALLRAYRVLYDYVEDAM